MLQTKQNTTSGLLFEASQLSYQYGDTRALDALDLSIEPGGVTALLGPNGAGKTTLIHLLLDILPVQEGQLSILGQRPGHISLKRRMGAMLQISGVQDNLTVNELLELFASFYPAPAALPELVEEAGLSGLEDRQYKNLSGGQQQRVLYALSVAGNPDLLILDEPTTGLDPAARRGLWQAIERRKQRGQSVLLCTHYLDEAEKLADHLVLLDHGRLKIEGSSDYVRQSVPRKQISCRTRIAAEQLRDLPGVQQVKQDKRRVTLLANQAESVVRYLLQHDSELSELEVVRASLESVFLSLTADGSAP